MPKRTLFVQGFALMGACCRVCIFASILVFGIPVFAQAAGADAPVPASSSPLFQLPVYCILIAMSSLLGGILPMLIRLTHTRMQLLVSLIGGLMLGVGIFHQLPHAFAIMPAQGAGGVSALDWCMRWLMIGLLMTFFMLRMFHFHSHEPMEEDGHHSHDHDHDHDHGHDCAHDHDHDHDSHHVHDDGHGHLSDSPKKASWIGIFLGLSLHTLLDGVALAAAVQAEAIHRHGDATFALLGFGTFLGVVLHKPLDSLSITSLMATGGWSRRSMRFVNFGYAVMCPIGATLFCFGIESFSGTRDIVVAGALAMSAGVFICISLSDLLPEVQFHSHDRFWLSAALLSGVAAALGIGLLEPAHSHGPAAAPETHDHAHEHDHNHSGHKH